MVDLAQKIEVVFPGLCRRIEVSLTKCWPPTTFAISEQLDFEAERFEHLHRCNTDVRLVITHKGVVPENDFAAVVAGVGDPGGPARCRHPRRAGITDPGYNVSREPAIESFTRVMWHRALRRNPECHLHKSANRCKIDNRVCQSWHYASDSA